MRNQFLFLSFLNLIITGCFLSESPVEKEPPSPITKPVVVKVNPVGGYVRNVVTNDEILPIIIENGDTVRTGVPVHLQPTLLKATFTKKTLKDPVKMPVASNTYAFTKPPVVIPFDIENLLKKNDTLSTKKEHSFSFSGNTVEDTGKIISIDWLNKSKVQPFRMKENAMTNIRYLKREQGLPNPSVGSLLQDDRGMVWMGTQENFVSIYDGQYIYNVLGKTVGGRHPSFLQDNDQNIWITQGRNIVKFNGQQFRLYDQPLKHLDLGPGKMFLDRFENIWITSMRNGMIKWDGKLWTIYSIQGLAGISVYGMVEDDHGHIWFATDQGIFILDSGDTESPSIHKIDLKESFPCQEFYSVAKDENGQIWLTCSGKYLISYNYKEFTIHEFLEAFELFPRIVLIDGRSIWMAAGFSGLIKYYNGEFQQLSEIQGLSHREVWAMMKNNDGQFWVGTDGGGINRMNPDLFQFMNKDEKALSGEVNTLLKSESGQIWIGSDGAGLSRYQGDHLYQFTEDNGLASNIIWSLHEDSKEGLWIGLFPNGLNQIQGDEIIHFPDPLGTAFETIHALNQDSSGMLWIGTWSKGLRTLKDGEYQIFRENEGFASNQVNHIYVDRYNRVWMATNQGLAKYDQGRFTFYSEREGLPSSQINTLFEDREENLWIGTSGGLSMLKDSTWIHYTLHQGLSSNEIRSIIQDETGNLWVGTSNGLNYLVFNNNSGQSNQKDALDYSGRIYTFQNSEGIKDVAFWSKRGLLLDDGQILMSTSSNITRINPKYALINNSPPRTYLSTIEINNQGYNFRQNKERNDSDFEFDSVKSFSNLPEGLKLDYTQNNLTFNFIGIDWKAPEQIQYSYLLEKYDQEWSDPSSSTSVTYRQLPHGKYRFKLAAIGQSKIWSEPIEYYFSINPPWWLSWWAYIIYVICFGFSIVGVHIFQKARVVRRERERSRDRELAQAREIEKAYYDLKMTQAQLIHSEKMASLGELTAGIAHEIQNPLNFVNNFSEVNKELVEELIDALKKGSLDEAERIGKNLMENEGKIANHGKRAETIIKSMLQHSRTSAGKKELTDINALCEEYLRLAYHGFRARDKSFNATFQQDLDPNLPQTNVVTQDIGRVLLNLINNAFQAVNEVDEAEVRVSTKLLNEEIEIRISDNGPGVPDSLKEKIFQPFFTTKPTGQGTGLGLSLAYDIVKAHHGKIELKSENDQGTEFIITLPVV